MADKLSKFNIKGTLADVIDAEARASIAELTEDVSGMASDVSSAVTTAEDAKTTAEDAQSAAEAAQGDAETAQTSANSALTAAQAAQTSANSALTAAQAAQTTANSKLSPSDAWKIGVVSATRNSVTIAAGAYTTIQSGAVTGNNVTPLFAYCPTTTQLACIRLYTGSGTIYAVMDNIGSNSITGNVTINIVYAYK